MQRAGAVVSRDELMLDRLEHDLLDLVEDDRRPPGLGPPQARRRPEPAQPDHHRPRPRTPVRDRDPPGRPTPAASEPAAACTAYRGSRRLYAVAGEPASPPRTLRRRRRRWRPAGPDDGRAGRRARASRYGCWPRPPASPPPRSSPTTSSATTPTWPRSSAWSDGCRVVTFDHEHVPTDHLHALEEAGVAVRPGPEALVHAQDKVVMRAGAGRAGRARARACRGRLERGRGRRLRLPVRAQDHAAAATTARASGSSTTADGLRAGVRGRRARPASGCSPRSWSTSGGSSRRWWPASPERPGRGVPRRRVHPARRHLPRGRRPGARPGPDAGRARRRSSRCGSPRELDVTGILAVELFETADGRVLVNELAMRPHNTGHWTQDGAVTSQFENHLRAVLDLPLGSPVAAGAVDGDGEHPGRPDRHRSPVRRLPARAGPRPAAAGAPLRQGACGPGARSVTSTPTATTSRTVSSAPATRPRGSRGDLGDESE